MNARAAIHALAVAHAIVAGGCAGDDDDDTCVARAGVYEVTVGPGTGTCDPARVSPPEELSPIAIDEGDACGRRVLISAVADGTSCTTSGELEGTLDATGISDAFIRIESDCTDDGSTCQHSYRATVTPAPAAGADDP